MSTAGGDARGHARVYIVIVVHNNWDRTGQCLASLAKLDFQSYRIVLVDNGSGVACPDWVRSGLRDAELLTNGRNLGYAQACNAGICRAREHQTVQRLHVLLQSVALIKNQVEHVLCLVAGECIEDPARYRRLIAELQRGREVRLNAGCAPERLVPLYFAACDVVALPYLEAAYSGVLLSAYAFAGPVVATAVGGNAELVEDGETGILVRRGDPVALAAALGKILQDPDKAGRMGARGSERLVERYPWDKIAGLTERVYGSFAEEPPHDFPVNT
jgi:glycosyltransferase involved in cell wall biosynthesis